MSLPKLIVILGPTASGKTGLSLELAQRFNGYIISADSRQLYQGMDIGTAKVTPQEQALVPHELINITTPDQPLALNEIQARIFKILNEKPGPHPGRIPFLVGGTGLYINSVIDHWVLPVGQPNTSLRHDREQQPLEELVQELSKLNPKLLHTLDIKNKRRVIRALEIAQAQPGADTQNRQRGPALFELLLIGYAVPKQVLDQRINQRVDEQIQQGLVAEVERLADQYTWNLPALSAIGYAEIGQYLQGKIDLPQAISLIKLHTRQYARRQLTWFKRDQRIHWITTNEEAKQLVQQFLQL